MALRERDLREAAWGLDRALASADHVLENAGTLGEFVLSSRELLRKISEDP